MQFQRIKLTEDDYGERLDILLSKKLKVSRSHIQKLIKEKRLRVNEDTNPKNGMRIDKKHKIAIREDDEAPKPKKSSSSAKKLPIIFEDKNFLVINKPAGLVVHPSPTLAKNSDTVVELLNKHLSAFKKDLSGRAGIVHRLDKDTSGVLLVAKNPKSHAEFSAEFKNRKVEKTYLALVRGEPRTSKGRIDAPLRRATKDRKKMSIHNQGKAAVSNFEVLQNFKGSSLLQIQIETGRTHQIRVHLSSIGHPIVGDKQYGDALFNDEFEKKYGLTRQFLHATDLKIKKKHFHAPLAPDLEKILKALTQSS